MNAQDKAKELVNKYLSTGMMITQAKQCAIIAVDEILNELECSYNGEPITTNEHKNYFKKVKQEIQKL